MNPAERRKQYIGLVQRRVKPGSGSSIAFLQTRTAVQSVPDLKKFINTSFVVVGGIATRLYMPERITQDLDILILARDATNLHRELEKASCVRMGQLSIGGTTWKLPDDSLLDIIEWDEAWVREALQKPNLDVSGLPVISLAYLILMKLKASRAQDIADITRMLGAADEETVQEIRNVIKIHLPDAVEDIESMLVLGKMEYGV